VNTQQRMEYILLTFEALVEMGYAPSMAWCKALQSYLYVFCYNDDRLPIAKAVGVTSQMIQMEDKDV